MRFALRLSLPDRRGALSAVASAIGRAGANIVSLDVVGIADGMAIDDVTVQSDVPADILRRAGHLWLASMRLLLVGAFPYPHHHGSQVYFKEQAIALRSAGAEVSLLTYGSRTNPARISDGEPRTAEYWRALDGFDHRTAPDWTAPRSRRSGPSWTKPLADLGLAVTLRDAVASSNLDDAYDAIVTHNAEAALIALHTLSKRRPPVLYCVHTLLKNELSAYLRGPKRQGVLSPLSNSAATGPLSIGLDRVGFEIDRWLAKRVDGWLSLTQSSERVMRQYSAAPGLLAVPPIPDPELDPAPQNPKEVAERHGLEHGRFFVYSGNLDGYQELDILAAAAAELSNRNDRPATIVVASHTEAPDGLFEGAEAMRGVAFRRVESAKEMQALLSAARASLVMRRAVGGFPIKLVNSLAVSTPVIAFHDREWGLTHERDSLICDRQRPIRAVAD
ncbi:MAG: glycosyltransferase, partial [Actinomycetota bacterium]